MPRRKTVSFHDEVLQCIAVGHDDLPEESSVWPISSLYAALRPSSITTSSQKTQQASPLTKIIEIIAPTTLKPESLPCPPKAVVEQKSWPSRTLSYFWDNETVPEVPEPKVATPYFSPPSETKSYFDMDGDEDDEDDEMSWNPPRPRKLSGNSIDIAPLPQDCKYISSLSSYPHAPPPRRIPTALLSDEESFEAEMFGAPNTDKVEAAPEDASDTASSQSSPNISECMISSTEDVKEHIRERQNSDSSWSSEESKIVPSSNLYSQAAESLNMGLGFLGATASAGINDLFKTFEQASSTVVSSVKKERTFSGSCSSEFNAVYRTNYNFAAQRPIQSKFTATEDEEHWWMNV